jgi:hypothetical protein
LRQTKEMKRKEEKRREEKTTEIFLSKKIR